MMRGLTLLALLCGSYAAPSAVGGAKSPIDKVVVLIKEMREQCQKDGQEDLEAYDKYKCWCENTEAEKNAAIAAAETKIEELNGFLEESAAREAELKTEIAGLEDDIAKDKDALASATANREKENQEFLEEEADMKETLSLLAEAIQVLSKVQLMQKPTKESLVQVSKIVKRIPTKFPSVMQKDLYDMLGALENVEQQHLGAVFLPKNRAAALEQEWKRMSTHDGDLPWWKAKSDEQLGKEAKPNELHGAAANAKSYNSRSGGILGILKQMGDNTAKNLANSQKEELNAEIAFQNLQAAKLSEIESATKQKDQKELELSDLIDKVAKAKEDLEETSAQLEEDKKFLAQTLEGCQKEDEEYAKRAKVRAEEVVALSETLEILTGDEARSLFDKTISFLQVGSVLSTGQQMARNAAVERILTVAKKNKNWALASLAVRVKLDAFTKVKAAMDKMLAELQAQQKAEYEKGEQCKKDLDTTEDKIKEATNVKEDLDMKHQELTNELETLANDIATLKKEVGDMEVALKEAGEQRKANNQLFQQSVNDQRATIQVLQMAQTRLQEFYTPKAGLVQVHAHVAPPPPKSSEKAYEKSANSGGVMQLLATIIADAESVEIELKVTEQDEQKDYAAFAAETTASIEADRRSIEEKSERSAQAEGEKAETEEAQLANDAALTELNQLLTATHTDCDWILKYFDLRQKSRAEEMDAIKEAKAILSGANFS